MTPRNVDTSVFRTLHRIHRQLADLGERLARGPKQVRGAEAHLAHQEEQLAKVREEAKTLRMATDAKQVQLQGSEAKIKDWEGKLMSASSNREYQVLKDLIAAEKMTNSVLDDEILEGWERLEQFQDKIAEAEAGLAKAREKAQQTHAEVEQQKPLIEEDLRRLRAELGECEASLPAEIKEAYRRVVRQRGEDALAPVENECCSGCCQQVPLNVISEILLNRPMFCKTCGRLLYAPEGETPGQ